MRSLLTVVVPGREREPALEREPAPEQVKVLAPNRRMIWLQEPLGLA